MRLSVPGGILRSMTAVTTIKVPVELRDRIAAQARQNNVTLAAVIAKALDEADERRFWEAVRAENVAITEEERLERIHDSTLMDDLDDPVDAEVSIQNKW
jgi:predicted transcriptional regulator